MSVENHLAASPARNVPTYKGRPIQFVIDVRSRLEYWLGHLDGAICIPLDVLAVKLPKKQGITPDSRILVYCASGARSAVAAKQLKASGYPHVTDAGAMSSAADHYKA